MPEEKETEAPEHIGPYRVLACVHRGNFSDVYQGLDPFLRREVAIKAFRGPGTGPRGGWQRMWKEARVRSSLDHGSVLPLYEAERSRSGARLVGPWLSGGALAGLAPGTLRPGAFLALARDLGSALDALHASGWVHGDLNGSNVLFGRSGRAVLIDFGSVRRIGRIWPRPGGSLSLEMSPQTVPPEAWNGQPVDARGDVYGLGALLYRAVTGRYPFEGEDWSHFPEQHCRAPVPLPSRYTPAVGRDTEAVLLRSLAKEPAARFGTGAELAAALGAALRADGLASGTATAEEDGWDLAEGDLAALPDPGGPGFSEEAVRAAGSRLERFAETLDEKSRMALHALLAHVQGAESRAPAEVAALTMELFGVPAALLALEQTGAAEVLGRGAKTPAEIAAACGAREAPVAGLLEVLAAAGLVGEKDGRFTLPAPLATLYSQGRLLGRPARPVREAAVFWSHLPRWASTGEPCLRMDQPDGSGYSPVVGRLVGRFAEPAERLAARLRSSGLLPRGASILDVGAGSAVWSLAVAREDPESSVTALDRPSVLEVARVHAEAAGLGGRFQALAGDWREVELPGEAYDLVLVANLCHLESRDEVPVLFRRLRPALRPGGSLVVVDTIPEERRRAPLQVLLTGLRLALRTESGGIHDLVSYRHWLEREGLWVEEVWPLLASEGLSALIARRPVPDPL